MKPPKGGQITPNLKSCKPMKEIELDEWFFNLPAYWQSEITGIAIDEDTATTYNYEMFDDAAAEWWDNLDYEEKQEIYNNEMI